MTTRVEETITVDVPVATAYNQFTQFEEWSEFMHRVTRVTQEDVPMPYNERLEQAVLPSAAKIVHAVKKVCYA